MMYKTHNNNNNNNNNDSITEDSQNTEKSPGDLRRLAVSHSSEKPSANADVKNSKRVNNNNNNNNKRETCHHVDFTILADHRVKIKESEKKDKYLNLARELKNAVNMSEMVTVIVVEMIPKVL